MIKRIRTVLEAHEIAMTWVLAGVALALIAVCLFGKPEHKAMALVYIVL